MSQVIYSPVITAFDTNEEIDYRANKNIIEFLIAKGVDGLVPLGSMGEFTAFSYEDKKKFIKFYSDTVAGRVPIIAGANSIYFRETLGLCDYAYELGLNGVLILTPFYFAANQQNIFEYYDTLASKTKANIYIYNFPARTGNEISPETVLKLVRKHPNIKGIKDTVSNVGHTKLVCEKVLPEFKDFEVFSGFDDHFNENFIAGGVGCISGLSNLAPDIWVKVIQAANTKDFEGLLKYSKAINKLMELYTLDVNFSLIFKKLMNLEGLDINEQAIFPYNSIPDGSYEKALNILQKAKEIAGLK